MSFCEKCFFEDSDGFKFCPICGHEVSSSKREVYHLEPGTILAGKYVIGEVLGFGGFGNTYKAKDLKLERVVAIKEFYPAGIVTRIQGQTELFIYAKNKLEEFEYGKARFLDEACNSKKFDTHKNIINIFDYFEENSTVYYVMEYLEGQTLGHFLADCGGKMCVDDAADIITGIADALQAVHNEGFIHRDVAPDNIYICHDGRIKLIDFGAARFFEENEKTLQIVLKPGYAPPEQYETINEQGPWTDIYALGATFYHLVTGIKPVESTDRKKKDTLQYPHELDASIPENTSNAIMKAMALEIHMRFHSIADFKKAILGEKKVLSVEKEKKRRKVRQLSGIVSALLIVALGAGVFLYNYEKQRREETLPDGSITLWCIKDETIDASFEMIIERFCQSYPNVEIKVKAFEEDEYITKLTDAINAGKAPELFDSTALSDSLLIDARDLKEISKGYFNANCVYSDYYDEYYTKPTRIPLAFNCDAIYIDISAIQTDKNVVKSYDELLGNGMSFFDVSESPELFYAGENDILIASTEIYSKVQEKKPGLYKMLFVSDTVFGENQTGFESEWSIITDDKDDYKIAEKFLEFLLSDYSQDILFIQSNRNALPLNRQALEYYANEINSEFAPIIDIVK